MNRRLVRIHVQPRPAQSSLLKRKRERLLADQIAARSIDQDRARLHAREILAIDDPFGLRRRGDVQTQHVTLREQLRQLDTRRTALPLELRLRCARGVQHPHAEGAEVPMPAPIFPIGTPAFL